MKPNILDIFLNLSLSPTHLCMLAFVFYFTTLFLNMMIMKLCSIALKSRHMSHIQHILMQYTSTQIHYTCSFLDTPCVHCQHLLPNSSHEIHKHTDAGNTMSVKYKTRFNVTVQTKANTIFHADVI